MPVYWLLLQPFMSTSTTKKKRRGSEQDKLLLSLMMATIFQDATTAVQQNTKILLHFTLMRRIHHLPFGQLNNMAISLHSKLKVANIFPYANIVGKTLLKSILTQFLSTPTHLVQMLYGLQNNYKMVNGQQWKISQQMQ